MLCARLARVMARESFEIYYYQNSRWSVHATFEGNEREQALVEAQKIEKQINVPVRLVRETFYPETNTTEEVVSWQSAKAKQMGDADTMFGDNKQPASKLNKKNKPPPARFALAQPQEDLLAAMMQARVGNLGNVEPLGEKTQPPVDLA